MTTLFSLAPSAPPGFSYFPDFLSIEEEEALLLAIGQQDLHPLIFQGFEARRRVKSYGYDYNFDKRQVAPGVPIPNEFLFLQEKAAVLASCPPGDLAEMLVTEYPAGSVINWHRDAPPFEVILGISLLSDCTFRFRPYDKAKRSRSNIISLPVRHRSAYIMLGEARSEWEHSISPVKQSRYSITFRTLRETV